MRMLDDRIYIGLEFTHYSKKCNYKVIDILTTINSRGVVVNIELVCEYEYLGVLSKTNLPQNTILRSLG